MRLVPEVSFALDKFFPCDIPLASLGLDSPVCLPNFPSPIPFPQVDTFEASQLKLEYWIHGLYYSDPSLSFCIESLKYSRRLRRSRSNNDGVFIQASPNHRGREIIGQLVHLVTSLVSERCPFLEEGRESGLEQRVPCYECLKLGVSNPFEFDVEQCLLSISCNNATIECSLNMEDPVCNHTVHLDDMVPDLLFLDMEPHLLRIDDLDYEEDDRCLLAKSRSGKIYISGHIWRESCA